MNEQNIHRHPEWKRLYEEKALALKPGDLISFSDLSASSGLDIRTAKGRAVFERFRKEVLLTLDLYLENVRGEGYRVIHASEHGRSATRQVGRARRSLKRGGQILAHQMSPEQCRINADMLAHMARLTDSLTKNTRALDRLATSIDKPRLYSALEASKEPEAVEALNEPEHKVH